MPTSIFALFIVAVLSLALLVGFMARLTRSPEGKILAFVALFILPIVAVALGYSEQMNRAESRTFCLSCHVMGDYGRSLYIDDPSFVPAVHFQNDLVPRDHPCYTCHTDYTMFGTVDAKLRGIRHVLVQYFGTVPKPADIKLYVPYNNRECLHCHLNMRIFEEASAHQRITGMMERIKSNKLSCISSGCHEFIHDVGDLKEDTFWKENQ